MKTIEGTVAELRGLLGLNSQVEAHSVMKVLKAQGLVQEKGKRRNGKGKPSVVYVIPQEVSVKLFTDAQYKTMLEDKLAELERLQEIDKAVEAETASMEAETASVKAETEDVEQTKVTV